MLPVVSLWHIYRFAYGVALKSATRKHARDVLRLLLEPCNYWRNIEVPAVLNELRVRPGERVLDIGSPKLPSLFLCYRAGARVFATDLFPYFFEEYSHYRDRLGPPGPGADYVIEIQDARKLAYPDQSFDKVFAISVVEHIEGDGDSEAMREVARVLRPGGLCCLTVPFDTRYRESTVDHALYFKQPVDGQPVFYQRHYDCEALQRRLIEPSGLHVQTLRYFGERWLGFEKFYLSLNRYVRLPFSVSSPLFSALLLRPIAPDAPAFARAALLALRKEESRENV